MHKNIIYYSIILLLLFTNIASAQVFPVQATPQLVPPYSLKLSEYSTSFSDKLFLNLLLTDITESNRQVRLKLFIESNSGGLAIQSNDVVIGANPIFLDGGVPLRLSNVDLQPYFSLENLRGISPQQYSRPLPEGVYSFCFEVFDAISGRQISRKSCARVFLALSNPPFLIQPINGELVPVKDPQNIFFSWSPSTPGGTRVEYEFTLAELWDTQIDPQAAFLASRPLYQTTTSNNVVLYGPAETQLLPNKKYGWRVKATATDGISETSVFKNNGYSEIFYFTYTDACKEPELILGVSQGPTSQKITWQGIDHNRYHIQYRKKDAENAVWFETSTINEFTTIYNLEPGTTYEFRVGGECTENTGYTYSQVYEFTTTIVASDEPTYNCGITPEIVITNQELLPTLGVNEVFTAGDFPVTVKELAFGSGTASTGGTYTGWGFIVVPYLEDTKLKVNFEGIQINTDYQLIEGVVYTDYDQNWGGVSDVGDEVAALQDFIVISTQAIRVIKERLDDLVAIIKDNIDTSQQTKLTQEFYRDIANDQNNNLTKEDRDKLYKLANDRKKVKTIVERAKEESKKGSTNDLIKENLVSNFKDISTEESEEVVLYDDEEYFKKLLQQIRCAFISGEDAINIPEKYLSIDKLTIGSFTYGVDKKEKINGERISIATVRPISGAKMISGIQDAKIRNKSSDGKISFTGFDILVTNPKYTETGGVDPLDHFMDYLFPTETSVRSDFDYVWNSGISTKINNNIKLERKEIDQLKQIASCGTKFLNEEERYKLIKAVLLYDSNEYYEDLVLDIIATIDTKQKAKDLYDRINADTKLQELIINDIDDITTVLFYDVGNENNLSRFTKEYFKLFKRIYSNDELANLYSSKQFPEENKFFFYGFDYDCDFTLSVDKRENLLIIKEQPRVFDVNLGKTGHCVDRGNEIEHSFVASDILAVSIADDNVSLFGEKEKIMMPALAYYLLIKAANNEEQEKIINGLVAIVGVITPFDEFYFLSQALKLSQRGLKAANLIVFKGLAKVDNIKVPLNSLGKKLKDEAPADINKYVNFVEDVGNTGNNLTRRLDDFPNLAKRLEDIGDAARTKFLDDFADVSDDIIKRLGKYPESVTIWSNHTSEAQKLIYDNINIWLKHIEARKSIIKGDYSKVADIFGKQILRSRKGYITNMTDKLVEKSKIIANKTNDIENIANNIKIDKNIIKEVKEHLWVKEHLVNTNLGLYRGRFAKDDYDIALWEMAEEGFKKRKKYYDTDLKAYEYIEINDGISDFKNLIAHEYIESKLMKSGMSYTSMNVSNGTDVFDIGAHDLAPRFSWRGFNNFGRNTNIIIKNVDKNDLSNLDEIVTQFKEIYQLK
ncbi:fibronectin type III domain-containing protein [Aquimarina algicola]|nr:fibronectin type III domain-containing protein [Aquimarina algicola]